jgi:hypothetical protein
MTVRTARLLLYILFGKGSFNEHRQELQRQEKNDFR